jgi:hypothetical protein
MMKETEEKKVKKEYRGCILSLYEHRRRVMNIILPTSSSGIKEKKYNGSS